ncbi:MAG: TetR/AcrR family transcriptional regulator [Acidovorax sp.]|nr:MAG: TetR/AcrR family transcriptional regulator [Acidovorax sp.]
MVTKHTKKARGSRSDPAVSAVTRPLAPAQPLKRPRQGRSRFTVAAIYGAFVRIWTRDGPDAVTMRIVALESGFAVGTLYEYFPNVEALLSGYLRHLADTALAQLDAELLQTSGTWQERLRRFVDVCCDTSACGYWDERMLQMEPLLARSGDYQRFFVQLERRWASLFNTWDGPRPSRSEIAAIALTVWGARRYRERLDGMVGLDGWAAHLSLQCILAVGACKTDQN